MEKLLGQAAWNAAKQMTKEKVDGLRKFLINKGKGMKRVSLPIYVPDSDFCCEKDDTYCMYLNDQGTYCSLGLGAPIEDEENRLIKPEACRKLG